MSKSKTEKSDLKTNPLQDKAISDAEALIAKVESELPVFESQNKKKSKAVRKKLESVLDDLDVVQDTVMSAIDRSIVQNSDEADKLIRDTQASMPRPTTPPSGFPDDGDNDDVSSDTDSLSEFSDVEDDDDLDEELFDDVDDYVDEEEVDNELKKVIPDGYGVVDPELDRILQSLGDIETADDDDMDNDAPPPSAPTSFFGKAFKAVTNFFSAALNRISSFLGLTSEPEVKKERGSRAAGENPFVDALEDAQDTIEQGLEQAEAELEAAEVAYRDVMKKLPKELEKTEELLQQSVDDVELTAEEEAAVEKELEWMTTEHDESEPYLGEAKPMSEEDAALEEELDWILSHNDDEPYPGKFTPKSEEEAALYDEMMAEEDAEYIPKDQDEADWLAELGAKDDEGYEETVSQSSTISQRPYQSPDFSRYDAALARADKAKANAETVIKEVAPQIKGDVESAGTKSTTVKKEFKGQFSPLPSSLDNAKTSDQDKLVNDLLSSIGDLQNARDVKPTAETEAALKASVEKLIREVESHDTDDDSLIEKTVAANLYRGILQEGRNNINKSDLENDDSNDEGIDHSAKA